MEKRFFYVKKRTLLAIAGCVWMMAGISVARRGVLAYLKLWPLTPVHILLSLAVFCAFGAMFYRMSMKHTRRIKGYPEQWRPVWHFFDLRGYCIMAIMMGGGVLLRTSGIVPDVFVAVFYTGLGSALALAGVLFWVMFATYKEEQPQP